MTSTLTGNKNSDTRPVVFNYRAVSDYFSDLLAWHKQQDPNFSVRRRTKTLRRCSHTLVSLVLAGKRTLCLDRLDDFGRIFALLPEEKAYLARWLSAGKKMAPSQEAKAKPAPRKAPQNHLLSDWLNVYVKDAVHLRGFAPDPIVLHQLLAGIASPERLKRSLDFLFREGFLRRTLEGKIVEHDYLVTTTDQKLDDKIQQFHRQALDLAKRNIRLVALEKRREAAVIVPLDEVGLVELKALLKEFYEKLLNFVEDHPGGSETLYQVVLNLTPIGGKL